MPLCQPSFTYYTMSDPVAQIIADERSWPIPSVRVAHPSDADVVIEQGPLGGLWGLTSFEQPIKITLADGLPPIVALEHELGHALYFGIDHPGDGVMVHTVWPTEDDLEWATAYCAERAA